mmetsp:Transcript_7618/g.16664  ORF Transcript_7618/g.16664 Transcript_7618/m.16664 type:complete len:233 (+) Transcript_7618:295-993(+)
MATVAYLSVASFQLAPRVSATAATAGSLPTPMASEMEPEPGTAAGKATPSVHTDGSALACSARLVATDTCGCMPSTGSLSSSASATWSEPLCTAAEFSKSTVAVRTASPSESALSVKTTSMVCNGESVTGSREAPASASGVGAATPFKSSMSAPVLRVSLSDPASVCGTERVTASAVFDGSSGEPVTVTPQRSSSPTRAMRGTDAVSVTGLRTSCVATPLPKWLPLSTLVAT